MNSLREPNLHDEGNNANNRKKKTVQITAEQKEMIISEFLKEMRDLDNEIEKPDRERLIASILNCSAGFISLTLGIASLIILLLGGDVPFEALAVMSHACICFLFAFAIPSYIHDFVGKHIALLSSIVSWIVALGTSVLIIIGTYA